VICTDPLAALDIPNLLRETGDHLAEQQESEGKLVFLIRKA
jgi:tRNA 2-thiouridine synthesizing protein A